MSILSTGIYHMAAKKILNQLYMYSFSLVEAVSKLSSKCMVLQPSDPEPYRRIMNSIIVATERGECGSGRLFRIEKRSSLQDLLRSAVKTLLLSNGPQNALSAGFQIHATRVPGGTGWDAGDIWIENEYKSTTLDYLECPEIALLHQRVGDDLLLFLFTHCSLFVQAEGGNFVQLTGTPAFNLMYGPSVPLKQEATKLRKGNHPYKSASKLCTKPMSWKRRPRGRLAKSSTVKHLFKRMSMFYSTNPRECFTPTYVLSMFKPTTNSVRKLIQKEFGQGGLIRRDAAPARGTSKVNKKPLRLPPRLRRLIPHFMKLLKNHRKCPYHHLLHHNCPLPEGLKEHSEVVTKDVLATLVSSVSSHDQVFAFMRAVLRTILPLDLWGSEENQMQFYEHLREFIELRRYQQMSVGMCVKKMKLSEVKWLKNRTGHVSLTDSLKQAELFNTFIRWMMDEIIIPTLKTFFYITESSAHRNLVFYYRKPVWFEITKLALHFQEDSMLMPKTKEQAEHMVLEGASLGVGRQRFLPKAHGVRSIVNLSTKFIHPVSRQETSINAQLSNVFHVLNYEKLQNPEMVGSSVFGFDDIYARWKLFSLRERAINDTRTCDPLLFVNVDISECYDSIDSQKLYDIMEQVLMTSAKSSGMFHWLQRQSCLMQLHLKNFLQHCDAILQCETRDNEDKQADKLVQLEPYIVRQYGIVRLSQGKLKKSIKRTAIVNSQWSSFYSLVNSLSKTTAIRNSIFTDIVAYQTETRENCLTALKTHLFGNLLKSRGNYYHQVKGISQGSVLSSLLCSFYCGSMEKDCLPTIGPYDGLLLRFVDDFLLITRNQSLAREFYSIMSKGIPEYNCFINAKKTVLNFEIDQDGFVHPLENVQWIPWCGLLINTQTLDMQTDFSRYIGKDIRNSMTIVCHVKPFQSLKQKTIQAVKLKCHPLLLDLDVLGQRTVLINIYQSFLLTAIKFSANVRAVLRGRHSSHFAKFFIGIISSCIFVFHKAATSKCRWEGSSESTFTISKQVCFWLGWHAFYIILKKRKTCHFRLLQMLRQKEQTVSISRGVKAALGEVTCRSISRDLFKIQY